MSLIDNKLFWKTVKPFFFDKALIRQKITLIEKDEILGHNKEISKIFIKFFSSIIAKLNIPKYEVLPVNSAHSEDPLENLVMNQENHPSIRVLKHVLNTVY